MFTPVWCVQTPTAPGSPSSNRSSSPFQSSATFCLWICKFCGARLAACVGQGWSCPCKIQSLGMSTVYKAAAWPDLFNNRGDEILGNSAGIPSECPMSPQRRVLIWCSLGSWMSVTQLTESCFGLHSESKRCLIQQLCSKHHELHLDHSLWACMSSGTTCLMDIRTKYTPHHFRISWAWFALTAQGRNNQPKYYSSELSLLGTKSTFTCVSLRVRLLDIVPGLTMGVCAHTAACMVIPLTISF